MGLYNAAATLINANNFSASYADADLVVMQGDTVLATHTMNGFTTSNVGEDAIAVANAVPDAPIGNEGEADKVLLVHEGGAVIDITATVTLSTDRYILGQNSKVGSLTFNFPSS